MQFNAILSWSWRWGIVGTGGIAEDVVSMMDTLPGTEIVAIGARKEVEDAKKFGEKHGAKLVASTIQTLEILNRSSPPARARRWRMSRNLARGMVSALRKEKLNWDRETHLKQPVAIVARKRRTQGHE